MYGYEWTDEYGIFRLTKDDKITKELRPVFKEELDFFGMNRYWDYPDTDAPILWAEAVRRYLLNGVCIAEARGGGFYSKSQIHLNTEERLQLQAIDVERLYEVNKPLLTNLEYRSIAFIREQHETFNKEKYQCICAFSGGKDSLLLLDLVAKALAPNEFKVVFNNTGMELSSTRETFKRAQQRWPELSFHEVKSHLKPEESWAYFGPPASRLRWCCSVHKSVPTILYLQQEAGKDVRAVVFDGVRAEESLRRSKYDEVAKGVKNTHQVNCHAILKWSSAELFIYLLKNDLILNDAYRKGIYRVGCMVCPMAAKWQDALISSYYPNEIRPFVEVLEKMTVKAKGKLDKKYIEDGGWQARTGGNILPNGENRVFETVDNNTLRISLRNAKQNWMTVIPIFGAIVDEEDGIKTVLSKTGNYEMTFKEDEEGQHICIKPYNKLDRFEVSALKGIANKTAYCFGCNACVPQCPTGAFRILDGKIHIRYSQCVHCYNCITYTDKGCMAAKSLHIKEKSKMGNPDQYKNFGLRQNFLEHFIAEGVDCFGMQVLGPAQYVSLKRWLTEANLIEATKDKKVFALTPLGEKVISIGSYNPMSWAIIWANLAYNSVVCHSFCMNIELGAMFDAIVIADTLDDNYKETTRKNAASALINTFRESPIGTYLCQGLPISKTDFLREGWSVPDGVAILYSLYLYAEHTGRRKFTLTELVQAHDNPDAKGISPADVFGLEIKTFRDVLQGLALTYPEQIRVAFIHDLDNIVLNENASSLDILALAEV